MNDSEKLAPEQKDNRSNRGASLVEYVLLISLVLLIAIAAMATLGDKLSAQFSHFGEQFDQN